MRHLQKIDLRQSYPCPCCRGQIDSIVLTEAFGCDRCQKIFALKDDGYLIEQMSTPRPAYWQWNGRRWLPLPPLGMSRWTLGGAVVLSSLFLVGSWYLLLANRMDPPRSEPAINESPERSQPER